MGIALIAQQETEAGEFQNVRTNFPARTIHPGCNIRPRRVPMGTQPAVHRDSADEKRRPGYSPLRAVFAGLLPPGGQGSGFVSCVSDQKGGPTWRTTAFGELWT